MPTAIPEIALGRVCGQQVQTSSFTLLLKIFLILQDLHYSSSESALRECHLIYAAGARWKMMQIVINHEDNTINIPTACPTYYLSPLLNPRCSALLCDWKHSTGTLHLSFQQHKPCSWAPGTWGSKLYK